MSAPTHTTVSLTSPAPLASRQLWIVGAISVVALAFLPTLTSFPATWLEKGGQGFVVAIFCGYLIWRDRQQLLDTDRGFGLASVGIIGLSLLWLIAIVLNVRAVHQAALPLILLLWLLAIAGTRAFRAALPIAAVFFLAVPVWGVLIRPLQSMTVFANGLLLDIVRIEAVIKGDNIEIPSGIFWVASGCAGLNFFETGLLVSVMYSLLFLNHWKSRGAAIALALALAIVANWLRVFGLIVIGHVTKMQSPLIAEHGLYGWLIFAAAMVVFFLLSKRVEAYDRRLDASVASPDDASDAGPIATAATPATLRRSGTRAFSPRSLAIPTVAAVLGPLLFVSLGGRSTSGTPAPTPPGIAPGEGWSRSAAPEASVATPPDASSSQLADDESDDRAPVIAASATAGADSAASAPDSAASRLSPPFALRYSGADEHRIERWASGDTEVRIDRLLYVEQGQGKELVNSENRIARSRELIGEQVIGPLDERGRMVSVTAVRADSGARLVWHWYNVAGQNTHSTVEAKLLELVAFLRSSAPPAELVAVSTICGPSNCEAANRTLFEFVLGREMAAQAPAKSSP